MEIEKILSDYLPFWEHLSDSQKKLLRESVRGEHYPAGAVLHSGADDCVGLFLVSSGQLRVYTVSPEGRELTLYRLFERDMCLFSASCMINSIAFDVWVSAREDTDILHIPTETYQSLMNESVEVSNYTGQVMASRFSEVMWLMDGIMNKKLDSRLARLLIEERETQGSDILPITHELIAQHLGSAREVITRLLKYFQSEGIISQRRSVIEIKDIGQLEKLAAG